MLLTVGLLPCETVTLEISAYLSGRKPTSFFFFLLFFCSAFQPLYMRPSCITQFSQKHLNRGKWKISKLLKSGELNVDCFCCPQLNLKWAISSAFGPELVLLIAATHHQWRSLYIEERGIRYSKYTAVYWQGGATFSAGAERCSALTITWLKVTENNNDWDEAEAITFGGEPAKTAVPIPFTKELSSHQMMRVTGFHFLFFPIALQTSFCIWKPTYYNLWTLAKIFFFFFCW